MASVMSPRRREYPGQIGYAGSRRRKMQDTSVGHGRFSVNCAYR
jgi:hypothetical protein